jgi:hypothetical protein
MAKTRQNVRKPAPKAKPKGNGIRMGVEGEGVSPDSFDVVATLAFVSAFVAAMKATANVDKQEFGLHSLAVIPGSTAFAMEAENEALAQAMLGRTRLYIVGEADPPHGVRGAVTELRKTLEALPTTHRPFVEVKRKREPLPTSFGAAGLRVEVTNVRGVVVSAGGMRFPRIHLAVEGEGVINPRTSRELAERAGKHLYQHVDAVVTLERDGDKVLESSSVLDFDVIQEMSADDEIKRWKDWFARVGGDWEEIDDIERELGREASR